MNKKVLAIGGALAGGLVIAYLGTTWWAGKSAEAVLAKQHRLLADLPYFVVKSRDYQRGFFSSTERTTIALSPNLLKPYQMFALPSQPDLSKFELTYTQTIQHGPLPRLFQGDPSLLKAAVVTDIQFTPETQKLLKNFFGEQKPFQIENRIAFSDDGVFSLKVPGFDHEEALSKVKVSWQGFDGRIDYTHDFDRVKIDAHAPGLRIEAGPKGVFGFKALHFTTDNARSPFGIMLGEGKLTLAEASFQQKEERDVDARLTDIRYLVKTTAQGDFVNSGFDLSTQSLVLNGKTYGPARLVAEANHLHGPTLGRLSAAINKLQREVPSTAEQASQMLALLEKEGLPLLKNDPELAIRQLSVKLPEGDVNFKAQLGLKGFAETDLKQPVKLLEKIHASADLRLPKPVIETYVLWQARSMIATDTQDGEHPDAADLDHLARNLMEAQIRKLIAQKLVREEGDYLASSAQWEGGRLKVNGTAVPLPWQPSTATAPAAETAAAGAGTTPATP